MRECCVPLAPDFRLSSTPFYRAGAGSSAAGSSKKHSPGLGAVLFWWADDDVN